MSECKDDRFLDIKEVSKMVGLGKTSIYKYMNKGEFPQCFKVGDKATRWSKNAIDQWMDERVKKNVA